MSELSRAAIAAVDPRGMLGDIVDQGNQLSDAMWRVDSANLPALDSPGGLLVCGMGGSAIGGDLAAAAIGSRAKRPIATVRDYSLPSWTEPDTLVLCSSYSGSTEETLSCWRAAAELGARRIALTTGGKLAAAAREEGVPVIGVPAGLQPRAAVVYMTVGALGCAAAAGAAPDLGSEVEDASALINDLAGEWGPDSPEGSPAKALAGSLRGTLPVIYGAGPTTSAARRWTTQINENAKWPAHHSTLPEADHNEIGGWASTVGLGPLSAVFLDDADMDPRLRRRIDPTAEAVAIGARTVERAASRGDTAVERVMSLVLMGDLVSVYMAVLEDTDPTPVEAIERFKAELA